MISITVCGCGCPARVGSRRELLLVTVPSLTSFPSHGVASGAAKLELVAYRDDKDGFALLRPVKWNKVEKNGASVLFEDPHNKSNSLGVVITPVKISSLLDFGNPQVLASKLIQAERKKESTKSVELLGVESKGTSRPIYEIEYKVDSSRGGLRRVYSAVTISSRKLYVINLAVADDELQESKELKTIVDSFDIVK